MKRWICWIAVCAVTFAAAKAEAAPRPNILIVLADDLGYSDLGGYGGEIETPNIDALARGSARFTQFYTSARCCPTRASLMTGLYPSQAGIADFTTPKPAPKLGPGHLGRLRDDCVTLAEVLKPAGYACYYVGKWHMHPETGPVRRGFDEFYGYTNDHSHDQYDADYYVRLPEGRKKEIDPPQGEFYATDVFNQYALEFLRQGQESGKPWLLFLAHSSPHFPVQAPAERADKYEATYLRGWDALREERFARQKEIGLVDGPRWKLPPRSLVPVDRDDIANGYPGQPNPAWDSLDTDRQRDLARRMAVFAAMVEGVDRGVGQIVEHLRQTKQLENTLVLFLSDNGACYEWGPFGFDGVSRKGETILHTGDDLRKIGGPGTHHSYGSAWANLGNTPLRMYKHFTQEGGISSPLIAHWPAGIGSPNRWIRQPAHVMDIMATIVDATGAAYPKEHAGHAVQPMEGTSLLSAMRGEEMPERTISFDHQGAHALRQGDWKIVWSKRMPTEIQWELYNIAEDRCEMNDLAAAHPERVRQMAAQWGAWARRVGVVYDEAAMSAASAKAVNASPPAVDVATPPQSPQASSSDSTDRSAEPDAFELLTPWGERVTAENGWREYPRPGIKRENWICLNGRWDFALIGEEDRWDGGRVENAASDPLLGELPAPPTNWPQKILIPFSPETQLSGVVKSVRPGQVMWYRRTFRVPDAWGNNRVLLHFEAVDWHAVVLCNGKKVAENKGGYVPFSCDVTDALTQQGEQELIVAAWDPTNMGDQAVGKQALPELRKGFRYTPNSGIWQSVWLEPVPRAAHIRGLKITPVADQRAVEIVVDAEGRADGLTASIIAERDATVVVGEPGEALRLELGDAYARWSPENPVLHDLKIELRRGEDVIDTVRSYFALRTIDIAPDAAGMNRIRLNGEPVFQFGPLDQGYWPDGALTPPSEEAVRYDLQYLKTIGCNMVRVHIKVHPRAWYYEADRLGLLVWQDFVCSRKFDSSITPASAAQWETEQRRMMDHLHNHPSIVTWIVFNEGWGQYDTERLTKWTKGYDPSRLVTCASGWTDFPVGDIYDNHDYSYNISPAQGSNFTDRATLCGECGGFNVLIPGHLWHRDQSQQARVMPAGETGRESYDSSEQWEPRYRTWLTNLRLMQAGGLNAAVYTQISDVEHECNGWLTYDRKVSKFPADELGRWHRKLYEPIQTHMLFELKNDGGEAPAHEGQMTLSVVPERLAMHAVGAGGFELFLNGELVMTISNSDRAGYVPYCTVLLPPAARQVLHEGDNVVRVRYKPDKKAKTADIRFAILAVGE